MSLIELTNVTKNFTIGNTEFQALKNIDLIIEQGEFVSIIGKSGSGKTTLMNMIAGIDKPTSGEITITENKIAEMGESKLSQWRGKNVGVVFQFFQLLPTLSILENVMLPMDFCKTYPTSDRKKHAMKLLEQMGIADQAHKLPMTLSGGQQQRAAIARALANDPAILLADEPTGNLDSATAQDVFQIFETLVKQGKTILLVTHDPDIANNCSRTICITDGRIQMDPK